MTAALPDLDLAQLIADTEGEIVRLVQDRDPSTHGLYEMVRYHLALDGVRRQRRQADAAAARPARLRLDHRRPPAALPGAAAVELGHNFSLVHDDIEDGDRERRHRPTLWTVHGIPQAINAGDTLFSLSRIALHRLTDLGFSDAKVLRLMRLYDETCLALCEGQYIDIATSESDELMSVDAYFDMIGRKTAALIAASIEAGALLATDDDEVIARYRAFGWALGHRLPAQRRPARHLGRGAGDRQGAVRRRPPQEDAAGHLRGRARRRPRTAPACWSSTRRASRRATSSPRSSPILERVGARDYTRDQARRYRDEALAELDAAGVVAAGRPAPARGDHRRGDLRLTIGPAALQRLRRYDPPRRPRVRLPRACGRPAPCRPAGRRSSRPSASARRPSPGRRASGTPPMRW